MSDAAIESWRAQPLTPEIKERHFAEGKAFAAELEDIGRAYRKQIAYLGMGGCVIGVVGMAMATVMFFQPKPPPQYIEVDTSTGYTRVTTGPEDAPTLFTPLVREQALREYVENREAFVPETDNLAFHRAAIKSTPEEQIRLAEKHDVQKSPSTAPFKVYGRTGFANVANFHFQERGYDKATRAYSYVVHFVKVAYKSGEPTTQHAWTADVEFKLEPKLKMEDQDRLLNLVGLQVVSYNSYDDSAH